VKKIDRLTGLAAGNLIHHPASRMGLAAVGNLVPTVWLLPVIALDALDVATTEG
jgi:hypothetical protein